MKVDRDVFELVVTQEFSGWRIDSYLAKKINAFSRTRIKSLIKDGFVSQNDEKIKDPDYKIKLGEVIQLTLKDNIETGPIAQNIPLTIIHEDDDVVVVDKPAGMVVHPAAGNWEGTLVNALLFHCRNGLSGINGVKRPGIVHRLDKGTTGLLVVAKNDRAHKYLAAQFADHGRTRQLRRTYYALVWNTPGRFKGKIEANLSRSVTNRQKISVVKNGGRHAITHWKLIEEFVQPSMSPVASLIECNLETGRTHQVRVHMAHINCPLLGDSTYGAHFESKINLLPERTQKLLKLLGRPALHAEYLAFEHPKSGELMQFHCPIPQDFLSILSTLRKF